MFISRFSILILDIWELKKVIWVRYDLLIKQVIWISYDLLIKQVIKWVIFVNPNMNC